MVESLAAKHQRPTLPDPLTEEPPNTRWCDIVMKGGVASGVVYPWAILELARKYRLRNLGGTSVGAMAAAIAAACEFGRRKGHPHAFEVLRNLPGELGKQAERESEKTAGIDRNEKEERRVVDSATKTVMLSLFQPAKSGQKIFNLFVNILNIHYDNRNTGNTGKRFIIAAFLRHSLASYPRPLKIILTIFAIVPLAKFVYHRHDFSGTAIEYIFSSPLSFTDLDYWITGALLLILVWPILVLFEFKRDIQKSIIQNDLGLCKGKSQMIVNGKPLPALIEWINEAIQRGAGLPIGGPPLTFEDLWNAPLWPGGPGPSLDRKGTPRERSINLEMITTNVSHGRPYNLPLTDRETRLFFDPSMWKEFFPEHVMSWLNTVSKPYMPRSELCPDIPKGITKLLEVPTAKLPIVVAARLSLSYPILFSTIPIYAIDESKKNTKKHQFRLCRFSDGGLCSNFPVHFFDSALPRWPTFGLSLEERDKSGGDPVWLPTTQDDGHFDTWLRSASDDAKPHQPNSEWINKSAGNASFSRLSRFLWSVFITSKDWRDRTAIKMPHVRRRVARLGLKSREGEGQLNIAMPETQIMEMASVYGTTSGKMLCEAFAPEKDQVSDPWQEHLWIRLQVLLEGLDGLLEHFSYSSTSEGHTLDSKQLLKTATIKPPILCELDKQKLPESARIELNELIERVAELEYALSSRSKAPHSPKSQTALRLRPPL